MLALVLFSSAAHAQDAGDLVERATQAFSDGEFEDAATLFAEAFELDPHPVIMFNLARAYQELGDLPGALNFLKIIRTMDAPAHVAEAAEEKIQEVEGLLIAEGYDPATVTSATYVPRGSLTLTTQPEGAEVFIAGEYVGRTPFVRNLMDEGSYSIRMELEGFHPINQDIELSGGRMNLRAFTLNERTQIAEYVPPDPGYLTVRGPTSSLEILIDGEMAGYTPMLAEGIAPGTYSITVRGEGWHPFRTAIEVSSNEETEVFARMEPIDARTVMNPNRSRRNAGTGLMASGGAVIVGGAVMGFLAINEAGQYNDSPGDPERGASRDNARRNALIADISYGVGGVLFVTGALLRWVNSGGDDVNQDFMVTPGPGFGLGFAAEF
ncbi:MAG: hypothetical protein ACJAYU_005229 [Bradymonadia bacterium]|jgi:hypothetical protein